MSGPSVPITERIAVWQRAYHAVLAEISVNMTLEHSAPTEMQVLELKRQMGDTAARVAATLAIGATTRERGE